MSIIWRPKIRETHHTSINMHDKEANQVFWTRGSELFGPDGVGITQPTQELQSLPLKTGDSLLWSKSSAVQKASITPTGGHDHWLPVNVWQSRGKEWKCGTDEGCGEEPVISQGQQEPLGPDVKPNDESALQPVGISPDITDWSVAAKGCKIKETWVVPVELWHNFLRKSNLEEILQYYKIRPAHVCSAKCVSTEYLAPKVTDVALTQ